MGFVRVVVPPVPVLIHSHQMVRDTVVAEVGSRKHEPVLVVRSIERADDEISRRNQPNPLIPFGRKWAWFTIFLWDSNIVTRHASTNQPARPAGVGWWVSLQDRRVS